MSDYSIETTNVKFINQAFLDKIDSGLTKEASAAMTAFVRQKLREDGFTRKILTPQLLTSADLDRGLDDQPRKIVEKEPDSVAANMALSAKSELRYFKGERYEVTFQRLASKRFAKSKYELATYATDIRQVLQDNSVKDIQFQEDSLFIDNLKAIATTYHGGIVDAGTGFGIKALMDSVNELIKVKQKPAKILIPWNLYLKLYSRPASVVGSILSNDHFNGAPMNQSFGFELIPTNKLDLLSSDGGTTLGDMIAIFAPESYLGQFYSVQEPTVFLETKADMIEFETYESIGVGLGNVQGFRLVKFDLTQDSDEQPINVTVNP